MITKDIFIKYILLPFLVFMIIILSIRLMFVLEENEKLKQQQEIITDEEILEFNDNQYKFYKCNGAAGSAVAPFDFL